MSKIERILMFIILLMGLNLIYLNLKLKKFHTQNESHLTNNNKKIEKLEDGMKEGLQIIIGLSKIASDHESRIEKMEKILNN